VGKRVKGHEKMGAYRSHLREKVARLLSRETRAERGGKDVPCKAGASRGVKASDLRTCVTSSVRGVDSSLASCEGG